MKKAFDQTVRDLKREVNKKVLKVPAIEQKILDATSNEPWGPHGSLLADIAQATRNYHEYQIIMAVVWKRINDTGRNWRHVYKGLTVLDYLVAHGSERVIDEIKEHAYQIATLSDFQYIDSSGKDQGNNVRKKSQNLVALVNDKDRIQEVRQKAYANKDKYRSTFSTGGMHRPGSYSSSSGYGDHYDDDHYHGYGNREDDRNGYGRDRDWAYRDDDRYARGGDSYNRDGDRYSRDSDERYSRDGYRNDEYRGTRGNDYYQFGSRNRSIDRDRDRSFDEDDRYSSRSGGGRVDEPSHDDRQIERKISERSPGAPPSYEEAIGEPHNHVQAERDEGPVQAPVLNVPSPVAHKGSSPSASIGDGQIPAVGSAGMSHSQKEVDTFDEFDPRSSATGTSSGIDPFGLSAVDSINSLALVPVTDTVSEAHMAKNDVGTSLSSAYAFNQPTEDPFGDSPFKAIPQENNAPPEQQGFASATSFQVPTGSFGNSEAPPAVIPLMESLTSFDSGGSVHAATTSVVNGHVASTTKETLPSEFAALPPNTVSPDNLHPYVVPSQVFQTAPAVGSQQTPANILSQSGLSAPHASQAYAPGFLSQMGHLAPVLSQASPYPFSQQGPAATLASQSFPSSDISQPGQPSPVPCTQAAPNVLSQPAVSAAAGPQPVPPTLLSQPGFSASGPPREAPVTMFTQGMFSAGASKEVPEPIFPQVGSSLSGASLPDPAATGIPAKSVQPNDKFETKSTVWADTLSRGLVNLNISGPKINPLADIGIDFDSINRMEKRREKEKSSAAPVSTVSMGKAMGAGSGIGRAGARVLAAPPNPMMGSGVAMGMGTVSMGMAGVGGYAGAMNQPMGMGMGMGMGMNPGMGQGAPMMPPTGMPSGPAMPGIGYGSMTGMGGYGSQQYGGYR